MGFHLYHLTAFLPRSFNKRKDVLHNGAHFIFLVIIHTEGNSARERERERVNTTRDAAFSAQSKICTGCIPQFPNLFSQSRNAARKMNTGVRDELQYNKKRLCNFNEAWKSEYFFHRCVKNACFQCTMSVQLSARNVMPKVLWTLINNTQKSTLKTAKQNKFQDSKRDLGSRQTIFF